MVLFILQEPPNLSAMPPTNPNEPQMNPEKPPANPNEDPTNPQEPPSASEARTPSRIPNQLRTLFSRVGRGSAPSCQVRLDMKELKDACKLIVMNELISKLNFQINSVNKLILCNRYNDVRFLTRHKKRF